MPRTIQRLGVAETKVTNAGLERLKGLTKLQRPDLWNFTPPY